MNLILFGPPGIGKSTIIGHLKTFGARAVDLEDLSSRLRYQLPNTEDGVVFGGADLNPNRKYPNAKKVLLVASEAVYANRRRNRDSNYPEKSNQREHTIAEWEPSSQKWDKVISTGDLTSSLSPRVVAQAILDYMDEVSSKKEAQHGDS